MSQNPPKDPMLARGIRLSRLRAKQVGLVHGMTFAAMTINWFFDIERELASVKKGDLVRPLSDNEILLKLSIKWLENHAPFEIAETRKFIQQLEQMKLNVKDESQALDELDSRCLQMIQNAKALAARYETEQPPKDDEIEPIILEVNAFYKRLAEVGKSVDREVLNTLKLVSTLLPNSNALYDLFTENL
jgi:hypothetical protein